jgi:hypothetical protein
MCIITHYAKTFRIQKKIDTLAEAKNRNMICNTLFTFKSERVKRQTTSSIRSVKQQEVHTIINNPLQT